jgi:hypothetical protein
MAELIAGLIDVFADAPLTGNPLAVVQGADGLSGDQMRRIAGEFNQAETTFILQSTRADRKLRYWIPWKMWFHWRNPLDSMKVTSSPNLSRVLPTRGPLI